MSGGLAASVMVAVAVAARPTLTYCGVGDETSAIWKLREIHTAQAALRATSAIDADGDGVGEYGLLADLVEGGRLDDAGGGTTNRTVRSGAGALRDGELVHAGYVFKVWLPGPDGTAVAGSRGGRGSASSGADPDAAESAWVGYAWPLRDNARGRRVFVVDQDAEVLALSARGRANREGRWHDYFGRGQGPPAQLAYSHEAGLWGTLKGPFEESDGTGWFAVD